MNDTKYHRRSIRLPHYDYSQAGAYFVTICVYQRECLLGEIVGGEMILNEYGKIADSCWREIPNHFPHVELDEHIVMPNHLHGIIVMVGARHAVPLPLQQQNGTICREKFGQPVSGTIPTVVRSFKSAVTKQINQNRNTPGIPVWQRNYYEHIIRDDNDLNRIREYIMNNPLKWCEDENNPTKFASIHKGGVA